ncbi:MAG: RNA polymerase sigma factor [Spirochaetales bacterium]|jgi:RNA polymerase sigma-70 factor (ECF subfamily)|nr:RNA polymerase sigma factor [Spirochaetales bacterium]
MELGQEDGFRQIFKENFPLLVRIAYNIVNNESVCEELCQEAFIKYLGRSSPLPSAEETRYWLIRVVKNMCYNYVKRKNREARAYMRVLNEPALPEESGESGLLKKETHALVRQALKKLPQKLQLPLILKEYGELTYKEIGKILGISEGNVKVRIFRARALLENLLGGEELYVS